MSSPALPLGSVRALGRRLDLAPDPLALYHELTEGGARKDTLLFETGDSAGGTSAVSYLVPAAALRATCRGRRVVVEALSDSGELALAAVRARFDGTPHVVEFGPRKLLLGFAEPDGTLDADERLGAPSPLDVLRAMSTGLRGEERLGGRAVFCAGVFAYDLVDVFEKLPPAASDPRRYPDYVFWLAESLITIDRRTGTTTVVCPAFGSDDPARAAASYHDAAARLDRLVRRCQRPVPPLPERSAPPPTGPAEMDLDDERYAAVVEELKGKIVAGDVFQIVPSRTFSLPCPEPLAAYADLRRLNPSPYMFYVAAEGHTLFGASPETCVKVVAGEQRTLSIRPIAGTRRRGLDEDGVLDRDLDDRLEAELRLCGKEIAEHMMLVDLARNDVARVSRAGTRHVAKLLTVERYSHVMHLVSEVSGELRPGLDALHAYQASANMGTLVGAPKIRATELLRGAEAGKRGPYGGAVGYLDDAGNLDTAIVIRSAVVENGVAHVRAGAGVVHDSVPLLEADETRRKAEGVLAAIRGPVARPRAGGARGDRRREVIFVDNFDSFTFNLVESFERLGGRVRVFRNTADAGWLVEQARVRNALLVVSPGPGAPEDAGCCLELIARARGVVPLLGVCLGHQAIVKEAGGEVSGAEGIVHGKTSTLVHDGTGPFAGMPSPLVIGRYHSLATRKLPARFRVHAALGDMAFAISDPVARQVGLQFHPESILTPTGDRLLANILDLERSACAL